MLNLNYNINKALGGGGCIGVMKYNYSASIWVIGAGGGGATDTQAGGGGGGGMVVSQSISIVPNINYQINVGAGGAVDTNGQDSKLIGFDDIDSIPIAFYAGGGFGASGLNGGNSGTGSIVRDGITTSYSGFTGGSGYASSNAFGPQRAGGGGASNAANGINGNTPANSGGNGASGYTAGGGGGAFFVGPTGPLGNAGAVGSSNAGAFGVGGNGYSAQQNAASNPRQASAGSNGVVIIQYTGKQKAIVSGNVTSSYVDGITTHIFNSGSGTFTYQFPYPYEQPVTPYQVVVCPEQKNGFAPYVYPDPYSGSIVSAIPGAVFKQDYDNLFGMNDIWDDISSYVRGNGVPIGSDRTVSPSGSGTIVSASSTPWDRYGYPSSMQIPSNSLLEAGTDSGLFTGFNITTASYSPSGSDYNWVAEAWVAVPISSSFVLPNRSLVTKADSYNLKLFSGTNSSGLVYQNNGEGKYTGSFTASLTMETQVNVGDPASIQIYQANNTMGTSGSNSMGAYQWYHIAFSSQYQDCGSEAGNPNRYTIYRGFFNGREIFAAPVNLCGAPAFVPKYANYQPSSPALIFGDLFGDTEILTQDFRFYKGTNKNYTSSFDVNNVYPIVVARPY